MIGMCFPGMANVGKSALIIQETSNHFVEWYDPTIEDTSRKQLLVNGQPCLLTIHDASEEDYNLHQDNYVSMCLAYLCVYSIINQKSFDEIVRYVEHIRLTRPEAPIVIVGNKCDLERERVISPIQGFTMAKKLNCEFLETSAKLRINVEEAFVTGLRTLVNPKCQEQPQPQGRKEGKHKCVVT